MNEFDVLYMESKDALYTAFDMMNIYFMESADKKKSKSSTFSEKIDLFIKKIKEMVQSFINKIKEFFNEKSEKENIDSYNKFMKKHPETKGKKVPVTDYKSKLSEINKCMESAKKAKTKKEIQKIKYKLKSILNNPHVKIALITLGSYAVYYTGACIWLKKEVKSMNETSDFIQKNANRIKSELDNKKSDDPKMDVEMNRRKDLAKEHLDLMNDALKAQMDVINEAAKETKFFNWIKIRNLNKIIDESNKDWGVMRSDRFDDLTGIQNGITKNALLKGGVASGDTTTMERITKDWRNKNS